uniref:Uncharacterized protein n=1 Tax=Melanopsichium pennsylvanicum 4 TaxID=1398559 RepID=A0A077RCR2_9BASI|nr:uncharacterized protein BN887_06273 [Melanopsichium pennsylvanicum 4]
MQSEEPKLVGITSEGKFCFDDDDDDEEESTKFDLLSYDDESMA